MADRLAIFQVTVAAGTASTAPQVTALQFVEGIVAKAEITYPDGCAGLVGARLSYANVQQAPQNTGSFSVANDFTHHWDFDGLPTGSQWQLTSYNTDIFSHTLEVRLFINEFGRPVAGAPLPDPGPLGGNPGAATGDGGGAQLPPPDDTAPPPDGEPEPPPGDTPPPDTTGPPPPPQEADMPLFMIHDASHKETFAVFPSGLVRSIGEKEQDWYRSRNTELLQVGSQAEYARLLSASKVITGGIA